MVQYPTTVDRAFAALAAPDASGDTVTSFTGAIAIAIDNNPAGGTLSGNAPVNAVNGVATFANLTIDKAGTGYTLNATSGTLTQATSNSFNITAAPPPPGDHPASAAQPSPNPARVSIIPAGTVAAPDRRPHGDHDHVGPERAQRLHRHGGRGPEQEHRGERERELQRAYGGEPFSPAQQRAVELLGQRGEPADRHRAGERDGPGELHDHLCGAEPAAHRGVHVELQRAHLQLHRSEHGP